MTFLKYPLLIGYCFVCAGLQAQNPYEMHWGNPRASEKDFLTGDMFDADSNGVWLIRQEIEEYYDYNLGSTISGTAGKVFPPIFEHYTPDLHRDHSFELKSWSLANEDRVIKVGVTKGHYDRWYYPFWLNQTPWFTYSNYIKEAKKTTFFASKMDLENGKLLGPPVELFQLKDSTFYENDLESNKGRISLSGVKDRANSKIMFFIFPYDGYSNVFNVSIFDRKMKPMWAKAYSLPFIPTAFEVRDILLSVTGKFYMLARVYDPLPENGQSPVNITLSSKFDYASFSTILLEFSSNTENANLYRLDMGSNVLVDASLEEDKSGLIHCAGGYTPNNYTQMHGCVDFVLNPFEQTVSKRGPLAFSQDLLKKISLEKNTLKKPYVEAFNVYGLDLEDNGLTRMMGSYGDYKGSYHELKLTIDSSFQNIDGLRIKKSQWVSQKPSDWVFVGSIGSYSWGNEGVMLYNDGIQGKNEINIVDFTPEGAHTFQLPQPDADQHLLMVQDAVLHTNDRIYLVAETKNHKTFRLGYIQRKL